MIKPNFSLFPAPVFAAIAEILNPRPIWPKYAILRGDKTPQLPYFHTFRHKKSVPKDALFSPKKPENSLENGQNQ